MESQVGFVPIVKTLILKVNFFLTFFIIFRFIIENVLNIQKDYNEKDQLNKENKE